jgi:CheY-like chemotaxis protein
MALIAIREPQDDIRRLIEHVLGRPGHEILAADAEGRADLLVVEPSSPLDLEAAARLRAQRPGLPIVCVSVVPPFPEALELAPSAYLLKPFTVAALRHAVEQALNGELRGLRAC